jgi:hypothetical protein
VSRARGYGIVFAADARMKIASRLLLALLFVCAAARGEEPARFLVERIDVRNLVHASPDVIKSESRLREGESYSESELREANNRIKRLPFLLDAAFSLERGSVRDAYVLVITVTETRPFFYLFDFVPAIKRGESLTSIDNDALAGVRWFAGRSGVFHIASIAHQDDRPFEPSYVAVQGGYTRYGLLNDRAFATLTVSHFGQREHKGSSRSLPGGLLGVSLTPNHTLTISYSGVDAGTSSRRAHRIFETRLAYNTTNHPYFPSEGTLVSIAPILAWIDGIDRTPRHGTFHDFEKAIDLHAARYWTLHERLTAAAILEGGYVLVDRSGTTGGPDHFDLHYATATLRLWRVFGEPTSETEQRIELTLRGSSLPREFLAFTTDNDKRLGLAWVRRNSFGVLRLGASYVW